MLLKKFKTNHSFNFVLFPLIGMLFWLKNLIFPQAYPFYPGEQETLLFFPIFKLLEDSLAVQNILALVLFIILAFFILQLNNRFNLIRIRTILPATFFVIMAGGFTEIHALHPVYPGALFLLVALYRLFSAFDQNQPYSPAFDAGFFLGISSLFYFSIVAMLPAFIIGLGILSRDSRWREFAVLITGFFLPYIFAFSYAFYMEQVPAFLTNLSLNIVTPNPFFNINVPLYFYMGFLILLTFLGSVKMIQLYDTRKVSTRKYFIVFFLIFLCSLLGFFFIPATSKEMFIITLIPFTYLVSNYFVYLRSRIWGELLFSFLLLTVAALQFLT
jgi:hypothetical protein